MDATEKQKQIAWQPLTLSGVAAFGDASFGRWLAVQLIFALLLAGTVVWLLQSCWFPVVRESIRRLPSSGNIESAKLVWHGDSPVSLGHNRFLAIAVDLKHEGQIRSSAHVQLELGEKDVKIISLLGFIKIDYPKGWIIPCNQQDLLPWWGAWSPILLAIAALALLLGLFGLWALIALVLFIPIWCIALFGDRVLTLSGAWRMAGAAQLPGALLLIVALFFYGLRVVDPVKLLAVMAVQVLMILIYGIGSALQRPKVIHTKAKNPFGLKSSESKRTEPPNPFRPSDAATISASSEPPKQPNSPQSSTQAPSEPTEPEMPLGS